jgi:hypothetical protein
VTEGYLCTQLIAETLIPNHSLRQVQAMNLVIFNTDGTFLTSHEIEVVKSFYHTKSLEKTSISEQL